MSEESKVHFLGFSGTLAVALCNHPLYSDLKRYVEANP